jgi:hypothetical protein
MSRKEDEAITLPLFSDVGWVRPGEAVRTTRRQRWVCPPPSRGQEGTARLNVPPSAPAPSTQPSAPGRTSSPELLTAEEAAAWLRTTRKAGGDGRDLVWLYGAGRTDPAGSFPTIAIMTSPFTTDPRQLAPRRLRSEKGQYFGTAPFVVGCGYAARQLPEGIRVVRLADGASWLLPGDSTQTWQWASPFALTCTELFAKASVLTEGGPPAVTYARLRLDSLGPATPAD